MKASDAALVFLAGCFLAGCSASPIGEDVSSATSQSISGKVAVTSPDSPEGVYVWLEGTSISTRSDNNGNFELSLPQQNAGGFQDGIFNLHFYLANYGLETASVVLMDGAFARSKGDVNGSGELTNTKRLLKLLLIRTDVEPDLIDENFTGTISVEVTLQALFDSVEVFVPKVVSQSSEALIFTDASSGESWQIPTEDGTVLLPDKIGPEERILHYDFEMTPGLLPNGDYEVIPFFLIELEDMPPGLLESLGPNVDEVGPNFLKVPFKREGGRFVIFQ